MNILDIGPDRFLDFDPCPKMFQNYGKKSVKFQIWRKIVSTVKKEPRNKSQK